MAGREELIAQAKRKYLIDQAKAKFAKEQGGVIPQSVRSEFEQGDLLGPAVRVADAPGGFLRTGLANAAGLVTGQGNIVTEEDLAKTAWGEAPSTAEYLERLGVPEGPKAFGVSAREGAGFLGDVVTSPAGVFKKAMGEANVLSKGLDKTGTKMYKSGLKNVDKDLVAKGKKPVSDILLEGRKSGSMEKLGKEAAGISDDLMKQRADLYQEASDAGAIVDMTAAVKGARSKLAKMRENPGMRDTADRLESFLNKYEAEGFTDIQSVSDWKTALYDSLPESAFGPNGKVKGPAKAFEATLARDFKQAIEKAADEVAPGLGKKISDVNEKTGTILSSKKSFAREAKKEVTPNQFTQVDAMFSLLGGGAGGLMAGTPGALAGSAAAYGAKNAAKAMNTTGGRTRGGLLLKDVGDTGLADSVLQQGLIKGARKKDDKRR